MSLKYTEGLRCEYLENPLGIGIPNPHLSWVLQPANSFSRGLSQSAYQIIVASSLKKLDKDVSDIVSAWKRNGETLNLHVVILPNTGAAKAYVL